MPRGPERAAQADDHGIVERELQHLVGSRADRRTLLGVAWGVVPAARARYSQRPYVDRTLLWTAVPGRASEEVRRQQDGHAPSTSAGHRGLRTVGSPARR